MEPLLDENQLAEKLGLRSVRKLQKDRLSGVGIPFIRVGRLVRYRPSDVEAWIAKNVRISTSDPGQAA